jgi:hypothetical protein
MLFAGGLFAMAALYGIAGAALLRAELRIPAIALAVLQAVAGVALLAEWRRADAVVRLAAGLSALMPLYSLTVVCFAGLFGLFSRPLVAKYFGSRVDPAPDRSAIRSSPGSWSRSSSLAALFALIVADIVDVAAAWGDVLWGDRILGFFAANALWAPAGVSAAGRPRAVGKVNRVGFVIVSVLAILGVGRSACLRWSRRGCTTSRCARR